MSSLFEQVFSGQRVLITGHTGFKGTWLTTWLLSLGANVTGFAKPSSTSPSMFEACQLEKQITSYIGDICHFEAVQDVVRKAQPKFIFHLAAQPIVSHSLVHPSETWNVNVMGGVNLLESVRLMGLETSIVFITSDKCYQNNEWYWGYRENDKLGGKDPYSSSKAAAELLVHSYFSSYFSSTDPKVRIATARAGNVIGGGDWSADRIVPDCIRAWSHGRSPELRNPASTRPWQHVLEPLHGYLALMAALSSDLSLSGESFNFGPPADAIYTVEQLVQGLVKYWPNADYSASKSSLSSSECGLLKLNCDKALSILNWAAVLDLSETIKYTADWYRHYADSPSTILKLTQDQIRSYSDHVRQTSKRRCLR